MSGTRSAARAAAFVVLACRALAQSDSTRSSAEAPKPDATRFCGGKGGTSALRNHLGLMLGNGAQDVDCEPVCLREIDRLKLDAGQDWQRS